MLFGILHRLGGEGFFQQIPGYTLHLALALSHHWPNANCQMPSAEVF
jgi:hypothetical protein